jgi:hypothetical protein
LFWNRLLSSVGWCLAGACILFALVVVVERSVVAMSAPAHFYMAVAGGLLASAGLAALIWSLVTRESLRGAAARLDEAAGLKERVSTSLYCMNHSDEFDQAVLADARKVSRSLNIRSHLPIKAPQSAAFAGTSFALALLVFLLFPTLDLMGRQQVRQEKEEQRERTERELAQVKPAVKKVVEDLQKKYPELKNDLAKLEPPKPSEVKDPSEVRAEPIKDINKLSDELKKRRDRIDLAKLDEFKRMATKLSQRQQRDSPVGKLAKAMSEGDFAKAQQALEQLQNKLRKAPKTEEERQQAEQLRKQLKQMSDQLKAAAEQKQQMRDKLAEAGFNDKEIKRALEHLQKKDLDSLKKMMQQKKLTQKQMQQLQKKLQECDSACKLASKLGQKLGGAAGGGAGSAGTGASGKDGQAQGFKEASDQLSEMEALQQEMNSLSATLADLQAAKQCIGQGNCSGMMGSSNRPGSGMGRKGQGRGGVAPEKATAFGTKREKSPVNTLPGEIISTSFVEGEQFSGEVSAEFVEAAISAQRAATDAIERGERPRIYHDTLQKYFERSARGLPPEQVENAEKRLTQPNTDQPTP